jgi:ATP-dependent DNA helicase DinG
LFSPEKLTLLHGRETNSRTTQSRGTGGYLNYDLYKDHFSQYKNLDFRKQQVVALDFIEQSHKPIVCLELSCGAGKSLVGMTYLAMQDGGTYLVSSKSLQSQLRRDFPEAEVMMGRNNFTCRVHRGLSCAECTHTKEHPCNQKSNCLYELKKKAVLKAKYKVLNYHYMFAEMNYIGKFSTPDGVIICDEADTLESVMGNFVNLHVPAYMIKKTRMRPPKKLTAGAKDALEIWIDWANKLKYRLKDEVGKLNSKIKEEETKMGGKPELVIQSKNNYESVINQVAMFTDSVDKSWVCEVKSNSWMKNDTGQSVTFKPTWMTQSLSERYFFRHGSKFVMMSATFPPPQVMGKVLGRPPGDFDYLQMDSRFDKKRRMVYSLGCADLRGKVIDAELPKASAAVNYILSEGYSYDGQKYDTVNTKGIIHTVSWKVNKFIVENDRTGRIVTHNSHNREEVIAKFFADKGNMVLASPSLTRGIDLKHDLARFVIWVKAPFLHLGDKLTQARCYSKPVGNLWYKSACSQEIVQGIGRAMRSEDDWMVGILIDAQIQKLIVDNLSYFAKHFTSALDIDPGGTDHLRWLNDTYGDGSQPQGDIPF